MKLRQAKNVSRQEIESHRSRHYLPGCKAILVHKSTNEVWMGYMPEVRQANFNPTGGVNPFETLAPALLREVGEWVYEPTFNLTEVDEAVVLAEGMIPFPCDGFIGKYEYIIALNVDDFNDYKSKRKLLFPKPLKIYKAIDFLEESPNKGKATKLYLKALEALNVHIEA